MSKTALFIRHQAKPGKRDEVRRAWEMIGGQFDKGLADLKTLAEGRK